MKKAIVLGLLLAVISGSALAEAQLKPGQAVSLSDGGWVCKSLEKAVASRIIGSFDQAQKSDAIYQLNNGSCIGYSVRPLKVLGYDDYLIPGYPEKGRLFVAVREPRSGDVWYAYVGYLNPVK
ncbi:hypothetical protein [Erwinia billingiae]|uniref:hypothetical protein n=1 Tax=Erwinia billingiae TaxID=182337 RepID=UPI0019D1617B|nr:hypothetical protein [Erwinia billingiae]